MSNALKKTMVFLGLAEEEYDDLTGEIIDVPESESRETAQSAHKAPVSHLRRVSNTPKPICGAMNEILTVHPTEYRDAQSVAISFRSGVPVIINLSRMNDTDAKRMIDFSSGLAMGLGGKIERVTNKVFLLSPEHITVTGDDQENQKTDSPSFFVSSQ